MLGDYSFSALPISAIPDDDAFVITAESQYAKVPANSSLFAQDQLESCVVDTWNTPFTVLEGGVASAGMVVDVRQPDGSTKWTDYLASLKTSTASGLSGAFHSASVTAVAAGRTPNCFDSWGAGSPAWYGAQRAGQVAIRYSGVLRSVLGRTWFSAASSVQFSLAVAGSGYCRVTKTVSGVTSEVLVAGTAGASLTEQDFLENGLRFTEVITLAPGDGLSVYYVQNGEAIGGFVAKAVKGSVQTQALAQSAPLLGCGLLDDGLAPTAYMLPNLGRAVVQYTEGSAFTTTIECPLLNPEHHDGFGFEFVESESDHDDQYLKVWNGGVVEYELRKGRLIRVSMGEPGQEYTVFTGVIKDFSHAQNGVLTLECMSFEHRLLETHTKNEPDELSYMTFGYRRQTATGEPVYGVQAYDNWALEYVVADMMYRGGVDASRLNALLYVANHDGSSKQIAFGSDTFLTFRARNVRGRQLRVERPVHYGNVGDAFTDVEPVDDPYKFPPENLRELWYRARDITDRYGYDLRFNSQGNVVLSTRANPSYAYDFALSNTGGVGSLKTHPSAFEGTYIELSGIQAPVVTIQCTGARIDLALPRGPGLGSWAEIRVKRTLDGHEVARVQNLSAEGASNFFYYDFRSSPTGDNGTIYTLYSGDFDNYTVTLTPTVGDPDGLVRRLDSLFVYHTDPLTSKYPAPFSTDINALQVDAVGAADEHRNLVYVVGSRKTTATDSAKLKTNPNNPDPEFVVSVAVDVDSIVNPEASNYIGLKRESLIVDPSVTDQDYADYLSRTVIYRYRVARPPVQVDHTLMPVIEPRDPIVAEESTFGTVLARRTLFVTGFTHDFSKSGYKTSIQTSAFPEFPSYEVRSDIDIDATFNGLPITNVEISYTSLTGHTQVNLPTTGVVAESGDADVVTVNANVVAGSPEYLDLSGAPWPPVPGTLFLTPPNNQGITTQTYTYPSPIPTSPALKSALATGDPGGKPLFLIPFKNVTGIDSVVVTAWREVGTTQAAKDRAFTVPANAKLDSTVPFYWAFEEQAQALIVFYKDAKLTPTTYKYFSIEVQYRYGEAGAVSTVITDNPYHHFTNVDFRDSNRRVSLPWKHGDGSTPYHRNAGITSYGLKYRRLGPVSGTGAFVDPYSGASPFYDPTTSQLGELVRFKFDALVSGIYRVSVRSVFEPDVVVAYLSEPTADPTNPESHWQYLTAGADKQFYWDGSDLVGEWNLEQSEEAAGLVRGAFESTEAEPIGPGWYCWNRERVHGNFGPLALISGDRDSITGKPVFGQGPYSAWFFQVECKNDDLADIAELNPADPLKQLPRVAATTDPEPNHFAPIYTTGNTTSAVLYMHLPEATTAELLVDDWIAGFPYDPLNHSHITTDANWGAADTDATINNTKPTRIRFSVMPRPGVLWSTKQGEVDVKLTRHVHPRIYCFDQVLVSQGTQYSSDSKTLTAVEERTLYTRRFQNDTHTVEFADTGFRKAKTFLNPTYTNGSAVWVFTPNTIKKNFKGVDHQPLRFADYLQVEELPNWDPNRAAGAPRSRYLLGFMAYLFYLSAYVQDRSGRRVWCLNRHFLDKSKITANQASDWIAPGSAATPATSTTYRNEFPVDTTRQFRRSIICRQWTDESTWAAQQTAQYGLSGTVGEKLLKHKWSDHEATSTTLAGATWPTLTMDEHSNWHTDGRTELPSEFHNMTRQLGGVTGATTTTQLGSGASAWSWEYEDSIGWIPNVTRDWHPFFVVPPMCDTFDAHNYRIGYIYGMVDGRAYQIGPNDGEDVAKQPTWQSWVRDMFEPYDASASGKKRFTVGSAVNATAAPNNPPPANVLNYVRQDELTHWESLRGVYSRGPRPAEAPKKLTPEVPYYSNPLAYSTIIPQQARHQSRIPNFYATLTKWFRMAFRSEYLWESGTLFPVDRFNREFLEAMNVAKTRFARQLTSEIFYDGGAWTGWKDDGVADALIHADYLNLSPGNVFGNGWMPLAVGPALPETKELYFHMVLLNERRDQPI
jgi:hypothetical protein